MNGSLKLTLAVVLALGSTNALALGLGMIQVRSGLNEPLVAEIPVTGGPDETSSVSVALAAAADFERVGLSRSRIVVPLEFAVATGAKGNAVIRVTTKEPVRDPFLDFLIEVNWAKGKLLREYTVLLDPPTMAPAIKGSRASTAPVRDGTTAAASAELPTTKPATKPSSKPVRSSETAAAAPAPAPTAPPRSAAAGEYGPVAAGETLWEVAASTRPDESVSLNQVMVALLRSNPSAFYRDNINSLKRGAILRVPSADEIRAAGNAAAAAAEVRSQNEAARGGGAAPTLVAGTGSRPASGTAGTPTATAKPGDRLELVPPKTGQSGSSGAERPGAGGSGDSAVRAELARTKEALTSREQEAGELKSRVRELEDLKAKNDKLLSLKDSELAALQQKLKELQDKAAKPAAASTPAIAAATPPASTTATATGTTHSASAPGTPPPTTTVTAPKPGGELTKEDIWGAAAGANPSGTSKPASATGSTVPATAVTTPPATPPAGTAATPSATIPAATPPPTVATVPPSTASATPGDTTTLPAATSPPPPPAAATTIAPPAATTTTAPPATTTPAKPATSTTTPAKPSSPAKVQPLPAAQPWYSNPTNWMYGLGGLAVLGALGFLLSRLRGKKGAAAAAATAPAYAETTSPQQDEEDALLDRLAQYPDDTSAHLELTSLYYSQGDADKFEAAAQAMYAHIYDTNMPEWQQVQAMGRELVPSNPLFSESAADAVAAPTFGNYDTSPEPMRFDGFDDSFGAPPPPAKPAEDDAFDFDLADRSAPTAPPPSAAPDDFSFDLTPPPPSNYQTQVHPLPPIPDLAPPPAAGLDDDLLASDDAIGTKLDLAKAYLDMGDPDGARSMLEEVLIEGSDTQKGEARKLLAEIR